ncbi:MAG: MarR family transcriptional regulator [Paraburkholderia sp.]|nr:MAG: MarR family transcriptional regulator [Paraburkholderia sp.]
MAKIQSLRSLKKEMTAVARGECKAPADAAEVSYESQEAFESAEAIVRLLTVENRRLLSLIETHHPKSVAELAKLAGRAEPNVSRTLGKMAASGIVKLVDGIGRTKKPTLLAREVTVKINLFESKDMVAFA